MVQANTDFGVVADDLRRAAGAFALLTSAATAFGSSLQKFRDFERQLIATNAIAGGTASTLKQLGDAARTFSLQTTVGATEAVSALQQLAQAGFTAEESLQAFTGVLFLAQATFADVSTAADLVTSNIRAFNLAASDTARVSNVLAASVTSSLATIDKLAFAFRQVAPVANLANLSIEETTALLNQLFNVGLRGEQAGTALRNIIIRLVRPLGEAQDILRDYGIATRDAAGGLLPLVDIFNQLREAGVSTPELARIFETEALAAVVTLLAATEEGLDGTLSAYEQNLRAITATDRALELTVENLSSLDATLKILRNTVDDVQKDIGEQLAPAVEFVAEKVIELIEAFRDLDPATQRLILTVAGLAAGAAILLASINALALLFTGAGTRAVVRFGAALFGAEKTINGTVRSAGLLRRGVTAAIGAFRSWIPAIAGAVAVLGKIAGAAIALTPQGRIIRGLITLSGFLIATQVDWENWGNAAEKALSQARGEDVSASSAQALIRANELIPDDEIRNLEDRIALISRTIDFAGQTQTSFENLGTSARQGSAASLLRGRAQEELSALNDEFEEVQNVIRERDAIIARFQDLQRRNDAGEFGIDLGDFTNTFEKTINEFYDGLDADTLGAIKAFDQRSGRLEALQQDATDTINQATRLRQQSIRDSLQALLDPEQNELAGGDFAALEERLRIRLADENVYQRVLDILNTINAEDEISQADIVTAILNATGDETDANILAGILAKQNQNNVIALTEAFTSGQADAERAAEELRVRILEQTAETSKTVAEAVSIATEAGLITLFNDLEDVSADIEERLREQFLDLPLFSNDVTNDAVAAAVEAGNAGGFDLADTGLEELLSGRPFIEALEGAIGEDTSVEEAQAIADREFLKYQAIINTLIESILAGLEVSEEVKTGIREAAALSLSEVQLSALAGLGDVSADVASATKAVTRRNRPSGGGDPAKKARDAARKLEDAFADAARRALRAREQFVDNVAGLDITTRVDLGLNIDVEKILQDADRDIAAIRRKIEDVAIANKGNPEQLAALTSEYEKTIELIELARDAEIDAATSFEAQMERRSDAIDLFIRDLETVANASGGTFDKVSAGIGIAFAEYTKDLVSLIDITRDATSSLLDATTNGISDFIFDNENAWENFKNSLLDISREVFEGFTKAFLQQGISSLTEGGGSIFGNILQPGSLFGGEANNETPTVGSGGLLGGLFGGGGGAEGQGGGGAAQVNSATQQVVAALNQGATQINAAFAQLGPQINAAGVPVTTGLRSTGQQVQAAGQQAGQGVTQGGASLSGAINQAAAQVGAAGGGFGGLTGGTGGGSDIFGQVLSFLPSFFAEGGYVQARSAISSLRRYAEGGQVSGPGTGTSDSILSFLSNGEFVIRESATKEFRPLLEAINSGALKGDAAKALVSVVGGGPMPKFAEGGLVGDTAFGPSSVSLTEPRAVLVGTAAGANNTSNNTVNNTRGGDTVLNMNLTVNAAAGQSGSEARRSADQIAKRIANQIERAKKNS